MSTLWMCVSPALRASGICSGVDTVPWICSCSVCLSLAEEGTGFGKTLTKPKGVYNLRGGGAEFCLSGGGGWGCGGDPPLRRP